MRKMVRKNHLLSLILSFMLMLMPITTFADTVPDNVPSLIPVTQAQLDALKAMTLAQLQAQAKPMPESAVATTVIGSVTSRKLNALSNVPQDGNIYTLSTTSFGVTTIFYFKALYATISTGTVNYYAYIWKYQNGELVLSKETDDSEQLPLMEAYLYQKIHGTLNGGGTTNITSTGGSATNSTGSNTISSGSSNSSNSIKTYTKKRLSGITRFDTATAIATEYNNGTVNNVVLATGYNYPDALAGGVLATKLNAPMLLAGITPVDSEATINYIRNHLSKDGTIYVLGGEGAVNDTVIWTIEAFGYKNIVRLSGTSRYDTCKAIDNQINAAIGTPVVIATGNGFADALSISPIAAAKGYPIVLTDSYSLPIQSQDTLSKIKPSKVFIVGGIGAVTDNVKSQIENLLGLSDSNIVRLSGSDRYETSLNIAKYFNINSTNVTFATGVNFPDALAGSVLAAKLNSPLILTNKLDYSLQKAYLQSTTYTNMVIFGGIGAVSDDLIDNYTSN